MKKVIVWSAFALFIFSYTIVGAEETSVVSADQEIQQFSEQQKTLETRIQGEKERGSAERKKLSAELKEIKKKIIQAKQKKRKQERKETIEKIQKQYREELQKAKNERDAAIQAAHQMYKKNRDDAKLSAEEALHKAGINPKGVLLNGKTKSVFSGSVFSAEDLKNLPTVIQAR